MFNSGREGPSSARDEVRKLFQIYVFSSKQRCPNPIGESCNIRLISVKSLKYLKISSKMLEIMVECASDRQTRIETCG